MVYRKMSWFVQFSSKHAMVPMFFALSRSYLEFWDTLDFFHIDAKTVLKGL